MITHTYEDLERWTEQGWVRCGPYIVRQVGNLWAVGDDDHRFSSLVEALSYAEWLRS